MTDPISLYKTTQAEALSSAAYDAVLRIWPVPYESLNVHTRFGLTHLIACGPEFWTAAYSAAWARSQRNHVALQYSRTESRNIGCMHLIQSEIWGKVSPPACPKIGQSTLPGCWTCLNNSDWPRWLW